MDNEREAEAKAGARTDSSMKRNMGRRSLLGGGAAIVGGLVAAQALAPGKAMARAASKRKAATGGDPNTFTMAIVGEAMCTRPFAMQTEPAFAGIVKLLREADLSYAHLEVNIAGDDELSYTPRGSTGGAGYLIADPQVAHDLAWMGIDTMSLAMNHSYDWGPNVMLATARHCREAGIAVAGTGRDLEEARNPTFFETDRARSSLVSVASGNSAFEWAGLAKGKTPGRPGVNPMRVKQVYEVPHETAEMLKQVGIKLGTMNAAKAAKPEFQLTPGAISGSNGFSGSTFLDGDKFLSYSLANPSDLKGNLRAVDMANRMSDFVLVAHHCATSDAGRGDKPNTFVVDFARKAIDAGADMYIGHGWHTFVGIEIYKGKPIFYGLGSFFWQSQYITRVPADEYESYNLDMDKLAGANPASGGLHPEGNDDWGWSAVFTLNYAGGQLKEIELHPIDMGFDYSGEKPVRNRLVGRGEEKYLDGTPHLATGANGQAILRKLQKMNEMRGTKMEIRGTIGVITV